MPPWGTPQPILPRPDIYPSSALIAGMLGGLNVPPDFEADQPLRYTHRQFGETDVYFVSNGESGAVEAVGKFRVNGRRPELWHPETGQIRELPSYSFTAGGRTAVPLRLESEESYFVVFRKNAERGVGSKDEGQRRVGKNFPESKAAAQITGPWQVTFDPRLGGPQAPVTFEQLDDWSKRVEEGIRHYSGTAVYTTTFELPSSAATSLPQSAIQNPESKIVLDLGAVHEFAQVRLNGRELGIAWRRPFRVDVTEAVRNGANELEVRVTNLWPNRMIGDESLPPDSDRSPQGILSRWPQWLLEGKPSPTGRYTFATWRDYRQDSPLLPSGLLGPVTIQAVQSER
jgi:hypothetical protein